MIPTRRKFPMRTDFLRFRSRANRSIAPHMTIYSTLHTSHSTRLSVIVPAKVSKLATTRNWLRRLTYDTLWSVIKDKQVDCVVVYKPLPLKKSVETKELTVSELNSMLSQLVN